MCDEMEKRAGEARLKLTQISTVPGDAFHACCSELPLQENELRTEGGAHGSEDAVGAGFAW